MNENSEMSFNNSDDPDLIGVETALSRAARVAALRAERVKRNVPSRSSKAGKRRSTSSSDLATSTGIADRGEARQRFMQFKVSLMGRDTEYLCDIWRRIVVPRNLLLPEFHALLQGAMGWQDRHLHLFRIGNRSYITPEDGAPEEQTPDRALDERQFRLDELTNGVEEIYYLYDFGDRWEHLLEVEQVGSIQGQATLAGQPVCVDGRGACPPEDCGGPDGYANLLRALKDPDHRDHSENLRFYGHYDPYAFNPVQATLLMQATHALYDRRMW